jgi:hypothetical protein
MTTAERCYISRALGPEVVRALGRAEARPEAAAWRALALTVTFAVTDLIIADRRVASIVAALWRRGVPPLVQCDELVTGRVGGCDLSRGCFTFLEACAIAARDLAQNGRAGQAEAALRAGVSVRELLRRLYSVTAAPEGDASADRRTFVRMLRRTRC